LSSFVGPPNPPDVLPAPFSGPGGYHRLGDILELRGAYDRRGTSAYGVGVPSNYDIYRNKVGVYQAKQAAMKDQAAMINARAMADQVNVQRQQLDPAYQRRAMMADALSKGTAPTQLVPQFYKELGMPMTDEMTLGAESGLDLATKPKLSAVLDSLVARNAKGFDPDSAVVRGLLSSYPEAESYAKGQPASNLGYLNPFTPGNVAEMAMKINAAFPGGLHAQAADPRVGLSLVDRKPAPKVGVAQEVRKMEPGAMRRAAEERFLRLGQFESTQQ
jgi:hypothetical protein